MNRLAQMLSRIASDLDDLEVGWAVVGGLAVSVWGEPRLTRDIDLAIAVDADRDAERLVRNLVARGYQKDELIEHESAKRLATARLSARDGKHAIVIDLLFSSSGVEAETVAGSRTVEVFTGVEARVASRPYLIAMKLLARDDRHRPQDYDDLRSLIAKATTEELATVREILTLITERGYARRRDLHAALDDLLRELA